MAKEKKKFEIHLQYSFAPFVDVIEADKISYGNGTITAVNGDSAVQVFPSDDVIIKRTVQNFGWEEDAKAFRGEFRRLMDRDRESGDAGVA